MHIKGSKQRNLKRKLLKVPMLEWAGSKIWKQIDKQ
jgi:hypothetical protein